MDNFTPLSALAGGLLIGTSAALLLLLNGKIAGISGILGGIFQSNRRESFWRIAFLGGLMLAPVIYGLSGARLPSISIQGSAGLLIVAGLLVGVGTRLGAGCTSGHGVCGIGRGSPRSLAATGVFLIVAVVTVFITRHVMGG